MISVVILNWKRTDQLRRICSNLNGMNLVDEIIVWNNNPEIYLELEIDKAKVINCSEDFGLFTRFAAASLAKNSCILFHDDDVIAPESTLKALYKKWKQRPNSCHSIFGRNTKNGQYFHKGYFGSVEIVLTRFVMTHRKVAVYALSKTPEFADLPGVPVGNGEDIILSHAAIELTGKLNKSYKMKSEDIGENDQVAIHVRFSDHVEHRTKIIQRCREVFNLNYTIWFQKWYDRVYLRIKGKFSDNGRAS